MLLMKKKFKLLILLTISSFLILSLNLYAKDSIHCEGQFLSEEEDSASLIKRELISSAFKNAITKTLKELSLDPEAFWEQYSKKFESFIIKTKSLTPQITKPITDGDEANKTDKTIEDQMSDSIKLQISEIERKDKIELENNFLNSKQSHYLLRLLTSYKEINKSRSSKNHLLRYIRLEAFLNKIELKKIYGLYVRPFDARKIRKILIHSNLALKKLEYSDLSISSTEYLQELLNDKWKEKIQSIVGNEVAIEIISDEILEQITNYLHSSSNISDEKYSDILFLDINFSIEKEKFDPVIKRLYLTVSGHLFFYDIFGKNSLTSLVFPTDHHVITKSYDESSNLSNFASSLHNVPLSFFKKIPNIISEIPQRPNQVQLKISGHKNLADIYTLIEELTYKIPNLMSPPQLKAISDSSISLLLNFNGELEKLESALKKLDQNKIKKLFTITFPQSNNPYNISLKDERDDTTKLNYLEFGPTEASEKE